KLPLPVTSTAVARVTNSASVLGCTRSIEKNGIKASRISATTLIGAATSIFGRFATVIAVAEPTISSQTRVGSIKNANSGVMGAIQKHNAALLASMVMISSVR